MTYRRHNRLHKQRGVVLVIGLIMLTVMTLLALSSMQSSSLQTLMSSNSQDKVTAFEAAESAIHAAQTYLDKGGAKNLSAFDDNPADGLLANLYDTAWSAPEIDWTGSNGDAVEVAVMGGVSKKPRYVIQYLGATDSNAVNNLNVDNSYNSAVKEGTIDMFKITARGTGKSDNSVVVLEAIYGVGD